MNSPVKSRVKSSLVQTPFRVLAALLLIGIGWSCLGDRSRARGSIAPASKTGPASACLREGSKRARSFFRLSPDRKRIVRALHGALAIKDIQTARTLLLRASPNEVDPGGNSPLHSAAYGDCSACALLLFQTGADPNPRDALGRTPLHIAAGFGRLAFLRLLLQRGARPNAPDCFQARPLHEALIYGQNGAARVLLQKGVRTDPADGWGWTPLHWAVYHKNREMARALLRRGAAPDRRDRRGRTPWSLARQSRDQRIQELIRRFRNKQAP